MLKILGKFNFLGEIMRVKLFGGAAHWGCPLYPDCVYYVLYGPMGSKK